MIEVVFFNQLCKPWLTDAVFWALRRHNGLFIKPTSLHLREVTTCHKEHLRGTPAGIDHVLLINTTHSSSLSLAFCKYTRKELRQNTWDSFSVRTLQQRAGMQPRRVAVSAAERENDLASRSQWQCRQFPPSLSLSSLAHATKTRSFLTSEPRATWQHDDPARGRERERCFRPD